MYFALVIPAELMNFVREVAVTNRHYVDAYNLALAVANTFQAVNFALNFLLYCAVNTHFRQTFVRIVYRAFRCRTKFRAEIESDRNPEAFSSQAVERK